MAGRPLPRMSSESNANHSLPRSEGSNRSSAKPLASCADARPPVRASASREPRMDDDVVIAVRIFMNPPDVHARRRRSEEHTSELQSLAYLVCRLLLEKKKKKKIRKKS